jgi:hypothetical protein
MKVDEREEAGYSDARLYRWVKKLFVARWSPHSMLPYPFLRNYRFHLSWVMGHG